MKTSTENKMLLSIPLLVVALFVGFLFVLFVISPIRYSLIDNRPILPRGYEIITDGDVFKWKKYKPVFFYSYESLFNFSTAEAAVENAWEFYNFQNREKKEFTVVDVKGVNMFSNPKPFVPRAWWVDSVHVRSELGDSLRQVWEGK